MNNWVIVIIVILVVIGILVLVYNKNNKQLAQPVPVLKINRDQQSLIDDLERLWINRIVLFREYVTALAVRSPGNNLCVKQIRDRVSANNESLSNTFGLIVTQKRGVADGSVVIEKINKVLNEEIKNVENYVASIKNRQTESVTQKLNNLSIQLKQDLGLKDDRLTTIFKELEESYMGEFSAIVNNQCMTSLTDFETKILPQTLNLNRELRKAVKNYLLNL